MSYLGTQMTFSITKQYIISNIIRSFSMHRTPAAAVPKSIRRLFKENILSYFSSVRYPSEITQAVVLSQLEKHN